MEINDLCVTYGKKCIFNHFNLSLQDGTTTCILGASGCGKTTLLKTICGLLPMACGSVSCGKCGVVFQEPRLLDNLTALDNCAVVMDMPVKEGRKIAGEVLDKMGLSAAKTLHPRELSGGMAQRVSIARAISSASEVLLLDEPCKGLDLALQDKMIKYLREVFSSKKLTSVYVTHSILEAIMLADRIIVLKSTEDGCTVAYDKQFNYPTAERRLGVAEVDEIRKELHEVLVSC